MSVTKLGENNYRVQVWGRKLPDGTRERWTERVHGTETQAKKVERKFLTMRDEGKDPTKLTVEQWVTICLKQKAREPGRKGKPITQQTLDHYEHRATYMTDAIGHMKLAKVTPQTIRALFSDLESGAKSGGKLSGTTRHGIETTIKMIFARAHHDRLIDHDPTAGVVKTLQDSPERPFLTVGQAAEFLDAIKGTSVYAPAVVMYATGARPEEMLGLRRDHLDLDRGVVRFRFAVVQPKGSPPLLEDLKTKRSRRDLQIDTSVIDVFREHLEHVDAVAADWPQYWEPVHGGMVFPSLRVSRGGYTMGRLWSRTALTHAWERAVAGTDWAHVFPYMMRHTFITHRLQEGVRLEVVSRLAGHGDSNVTARYSHAGEDELSGVMVPLPAEPQDAKA